MDPLIRAKNRYLHCAYGDVALHARQGARERGYAAFSLPYR